MDLRTPWPSPQLEEEYNILLEKTTEQYAKTPEKIAEMVKTVHPDLSSPLRYVYARAFEEVLTGLGRDKPPRATYDTVCRTGLIGTLLEIALDPRLYMFHDPTSSYYHPQLGKYTTSIFAMLNRCCDYVLQSTDETIGGGPYEEIVLRQLPKTQKLWALLWVNRHLFDPIAQNDIVCHLTKQEMGHHYFRDVVISVIRNALACHYRTVRQREQPAWCDGVDEILLYAWQYIDEYYWVRQHIAAAMSAHLLNRPVEKSKRSISKVITSSNVAAQIVKAICYDLERIQAIWGTTLMHYLTAFKLLVKYSPKFSAAVAKDPNTFRALAVACQRQLCSVGENEYELNNITDGFLIIETMVLDHARLMHSDRLFYLQDVDAAMLLVRIGGKVVGPAISQGRTGLQASILAYYMMLSVAGPSLPPERYSPLARMLHQSWYYGMEELKKLGYRRGQMRFLAVENWRSLAEKLEIDTRTPPADLEHFENLSTKRYGHSCHWRGCLCSGGSTHLYRVCTGCWGAFYCNTNCQTKDWLNHRGVCGGRRPK